MIPDPNHISYHSNAHNNQYFLMVFGCLLLLVSFLLFIFQSISSPQQIIFISLSGIILILIGFLKWFEPNEVLCTNETCMTYFHRQGSWQIAKNNIQKITHISIHHNLENMELPYIGIKLKQPLASSNQINPRLANHLIHEQKNLLVLAVGLQQLTLQQAQINFAPFKVLGQQPITGPVAAWLYQMQSLRKVYGCDLYIPLNNLKLNDQNPIQQLTQWLTY